MGKPGKKAGKGLLPPTNPARRTDPTKTSLRDQRTIKRLKMYKSRIKRDEKGNIVAGSVLSASDRVQTQMARIAPDRRWFGNTRVIGQDALQRFRAEMGAKYKDPYSVIVRQSKLPLSLLEEPKTSDGSVRRQMAWQDTFGDKATRKRVRLAALDESALAQQARSRAERYADGGDDGKATATPRKSSKAAAAAVAAASGERVDRSKNGILFTKGQSTRIWNELHKVIDSADVLLYVCDARDPLGTRSAFLEDYLRREKKYKHFVLVLNKCDLVPLWVTARWLQVLSKDFPTIAFHASVNHPFGKGNVISLLRQFAKLHNLTHRGSKRTKTPISVGVIGYPNVGKSSLINTLRRKAVCKVAPVPGETKVWQYVALTRTIFLIDCPGVVYDREANNEVQAVLKGVVRIERLGNADKTDVVHTVLQICKPQDITATYGVRAWRDVNDFLEQLARLRGKLVSGGEPDTEAAARAVLYDWQRGRLPWYNAPPFDTNKMYRDAVARPAEQQMKLIEHYSTFNVADDALQRAEKDDDDVNDDSVDDDHTEGATSSCSAPSDTDTTPRHEETVLTHMLAQEEQARKAQRAKRRAVRARPAADAKDDGSHNNGSDDKDSAAAATARHNSSSDVDADKEDDTDALWAKFVAAAAA